MTIRLRGVAALAATLLVGVSLATSVAGQQQPPAQDGQRQGGGGRRGDATPPAPPPAQPGHPAGKLVIWGDLASFDNPPTVPTRCPRLKRLLRMQWVGETENTATMVVHVNYMGRTIDVPTRWRGVGGFPAAEYPRQPSEMWTGVWVVPMDAQPGRLSYTVTATDRFGRTATFTPFINVVPQLTIVE